MSDVLERRAEYEYASVRTRISWGAILAGAAVAMALYVLLMSLGVAIGLSVGDEMNARSLGMGAGVWGFISLLIALFAGGWVTTQVTVGESRTEAILYGVVLWATTSVLLFWLSANGIQAGMSTAKAMQDMSRTEASSTAMTDPTAENQFPQTRIRDASREGAWWAFAGILLSMVAAIGGAMVGPVELTVRRENRYPRGRQIPVTRDEL